MPMNKNGYIVPTTQEIEQLERILSTDLTRGRLGFELMPEKSTMKAHVTFNKPNVFKGLMPGRGVGKPVPNRSSGTPMHGTLCVMPSSSWGDSRCISEQYLTEVASPSDWQSPTDLTEVIAHYQEELTHQMTNLKEKLIWDVLTTGFFRAYDEFGTLIQERRYNTNIATVSNPWSDQINSTPIKDIQCLTMHGRTTDAMFDSSAVIYVNQVTLNCLFDNMNPDDLGGKLRGTGCCQPIGLDEVNNHMIGRNLPRFQVYEGRYLDENENIMMYLPDGVAIIIGVRPSGVPVGNMWSTRHTVTCAAGSGTWSMIRDSCEYGEVPRHIDVKQGFNGAPTLQYPSSVITLYTGCQNDCP